jgi:hypothetical protein
MCKNLKIFAFEISFDFYLCIYFDHTWSKLPIINAQEVRLTVFNESLIYGQSQFSGFPPLQITIQQTFHLCFTVLVLFLGTYQTQNHWNEDMIVFYCWVTNFKSHGHI